jgi:hypothetical protein
VRGVILVSLENASFHMVHVYTINCPLLSIQCMSRRDLSVKGGASERCYRTRRGRTDEQQYAIISPYFDGRIKMNGPYPCVQFFFYIFKLNLLSNYKKKINIMILKKIKLSKISKRGR